MLVLNFISGIQIEFEDAPVIKQADGSNQTYAKQQLGVKPNETKMLGMHWNKNKDVISVSVPEKTDKTKRGILRFLASIFDPLGIISPVMLYGKILYRESCDLKIGWDKPITNDLLKKCQSGRVSYLKSRSPKINYII